MKTIVFYDNQCSVCCYWVNWILKNDRESIFHFTALESDFAKDFSKQHNYKIPRETLLVWDYSVGFLKKSDAVIFIFQALSPNSFSLMVLKLFPKLLRDIGYFFFAYFRRYIPIKECRRIPLSKNENRFLINRSSQNFTNNLKD